MLNGIYYNDEEGQCWKGITSNPSSETTCNFNTGEDLPKGLDEKARNMIDKDILWNLGGHSESNLTAKQLYEKERGVTVYEGKERKLEWSKTNDEDGNYNGKGLIYPSDYGYATNGESVGRETCFNISMYDGWLNDLYKNDCAGTNWLKMDNGVMWTITPNSGTYDRNDIVNISCIVSYYVNYAYTVWPTLYLKSSVKILENPNLNLEYGSVDNPFILEA